MGAGTRKRTVAAATTAGVVLVLAITLAVCRVTRVPAVHVISGALIVDHQDPHLQRPIANATVTITSESRSWTVKSETSGLFRVRIEPAVSADRTVVITAEHADYAPAVVTTLAAERLHVLRLTPLHALATTSPDQTPITNIRIRYATNTTNTATVGTALRTLDVRNTGNVACNGQPPCSPDGKWKATINSLTLDTGEPKKNFRNARVSCIAGPCPFSAIEKDGFSRGGRSISVSVRNWSDPVTYLLEAEVAATLESELIRHTYPIVFGRTMNFTLPATSRGPSIEAELDGSEIVFPLGPELRLSWATCRFQEGANGTKQYRCELKPGYRFN